MRELNIGDTVEYLDGKVKRRGDIKHIFQTAGGTKLLVDVWVADTKSSYWKQPVLLAEEVVPIA